MGTRRWILWQGLTTPGIERVTADLALDEDGMVLQYGVDWKAVATSGELA